MKVLTFCFVAYLICNAEAGRRVLKPLDKSANVDFINMEGGGGVRPAPGPAAKPGSGPVAPASGPVKSASSPPQSPNKATVSVLTPPNYQVAEPLKPAAVHPKPEVATVVKPAPKTTPVQPHAAAAGVGVSRPVSAGPTGGNQPATPGPGSVKSLITYYDSRGQASQIRPYSYSQAVKQSKHKTQ